jgi:hypothetical protein
MSQPTTSGNPSVPSREQSTAHASRAALGVHLRQLDLFGPIRERVHIPQKTVRDTPVDQLYDAFIALLAWRGPVAWSRSMGGGRAAPALQAAFGRTACAEQSVVQEPLDTCRRVARRRSRSWSRRWTRSTASTALATGTTTSSSGRCSTSP